MIDYLTGVLVVITAFYAWATYMILKANEKVVAVMQAQHDSMTRPYITIRAFIEPGNPIISLEVKNTGLTAATALQLTLDKNFHPFGEKTQGGSLKQANAFQYPIESFAPGTALGFYLGTGPDLFNEKADHELTPLVFKITAQYSYGGKTVTEETAVDLKQFLGTRLGESPLVHELKEIQRVLGTITASIGKLKA